MERWTARAHRFFASFRFPAFALSLLVFYKLLLLTALLLPVGDDALGRFAEEFKTWCFGYDPATGKLQPAYVLMMLSEPVALAGILVLVWWGPLAELWRSPRRGLPFAGAALAIVVAGASAFGLLRTGTPEGELPFPADRLRTSLPAPRLALTDHEGRPVSLDELRGRVVVLTGVYATCGYTCPMILGQAKRAVAALSPPERADVTMLAVTLDPERDGPAELARMAEGQGVSAPAFRLATGPAEEVNRVLDALQIARRRDPETGVIDHANLFVVVDRSGRVAYRFTLGERQERWLESALRLLVAEQRPVG